MKIKALQDKVSNSKKIRNILYIAMILFCVFYTFSIPSFSGNKFHLVSYAAMALLTGATFCYYFFFVRSAFDKRLLLIFVFVFISLIGTVLFSHVFRRWLSILLMVFTFIVFYYSFRCIKDPFLILRIFITSFLMFAVFFMIIYKNNILHPHFSQRIGAYFDNVNLIGTYFSIASMLSAYMVLFLKKRLSFLYLIPTFLFLYLGLLTGSRQFLITTFFSILIVIYLRLTQKRWLFFVILVSFIVGIVLLVNLPFMAYYKEMILRAFATFGLGDSRTDASVIERVLWQQYGFVLGSKNLIIGYGADGFAIYSSIGTYSHNNYSELICNFGVFGLISFYLPLLVALIIAIRSKSSNLKIIIPIAVFYLIKGVFGVYYYYKDYFVMLALCQYLSSPYSFGKHRVSWSKNDNPNFKEVYI